MRKALTLTTLAAALAIACSAFGGLAAADNLRLHSFGGGGHGASQSFGAGPTTGVHAINCNPSSGRYNYTCTCTTDGHCTYLEIFCADNGNGYYSCDDDETTAAAVPPRRRLNATPRSSH